QSHTRTLFREGLTKVLRGQPHFLSELENLLFRQSFFGLAGTDLQLGCARENALQRAAIEAGRRTTRWEIRIICHAWNIRRWRRQILRFARAVRPINQMPPSTTSSWRVIASRMASGRANVEVKS